MARRLFRALCSHACAVSLFVEFSCAVASRTTPGRGGLPSLYGLRGGFEELTARHVEVHHDVHHGDLGHEEDYDRFGHAIVHHAGDAPTLKQASDLFSCHAAGEDRSREVQHEAAVFDGFLAGYLRHHVFDPIEHLAEALHFACDVDRIEHPESAEVAVEVGRAAGSVAVGEAAWTPEEEAPEEAAPRRHPCLASTRDALAIVEEARRELAGWAGAREDAREQGPDSGKSSGMSSQRRAAKGVSATIAVLGARSGLPVPSGARGELRQTIGSAERGAELGKGPRFHEDIAELAKPEEFADVGIAATHLTDVTEHVAAAHELLLDLQVPTELSSLAKSASSLAKQDNDWRAVFGGANTLVDEAVKQGLGELRVIDDLMSLAQLADTLKAVASHLQGYVVSRRAAVMAGAGALPAVRAAAALAMDEGVDLEPLVDTKVVFDLVKGSDAIVRLAALWDRLPSEVCHSVTHDAASGAFLAQLQPLADQFA